MEGITKKKWLAAVIVFAVIVLAVGLVKLFPFWVTLAIFVAFVAGLVVSWLLRNVQTQENTEEENIGTCSNLSTGDDIEEEV